MKITRDVSVNIHGFAAQYGLATDVTIKLDPRPCGSDVSGDITDDYVLPAGCQIPANWGADFNRLAKGVDVSVHRTFNFNGLPSQRRTTCCRRINRDVIARHKQVVCCACIMRNAVSHCKHVLPDCCTGLVFLRLYGRADQNQNRCY